MSLGLPPEALALGTAACVAASGMMVSEAFAGASVLTVTRWNIVFTFLLHATITTLIGAWASLDTRDVALLLLSGLLAILVAAPAYYGSMALIGPRAGVLVFSLNAPLTSFIGWPLLGERPGTFAILGMLLVITGIALATWPRNTGEQVPRRRLYLGIGLGVLGALGQATGVLAAKPVMAAGASPFAAMAVRFGIAAVILVLLQATPWSRHFHASAGRAKALALTICAALIINGVGMTILMIALAHAQAGVVATLSATSPILILPMLWLRRREMPTPAAWLGALVTVAGSALVLLA